MFKTILFQNINVRCIKCGVSDKEKKFIEVFCIDCYEFPIKKPKPIEIVKCKRCERFRIRGEWKDIEWEEVKEFLANRIKADFEWAEIKVKDKKAILHFNIGGEETTRAIRYDVNVKIGMCEDCSKMSGNYFEAIIQLRGNSYKVDKVGEKLFKHIHRRGAFVSKVDELKEGIDLYVSSSKIAFELIKEFGYSYKISRKLHGLKQGKRIYRTTFALRF